MVYPHWIYDVPASMVMPSKACDHALMPANLLEHLLRGAEDEGHGIKNLGHTQCGVCHNDGGG